MIPASHNPIPAAVAGIAVYLAAWFLLVALADLVVRGVVLVKRVRDLATIRTMSLANPETYVGHCSACHEKCGLSSRQPNHAQPAHDQLPLPLLRKST